jgi:hypothetical protein
MFRPRISDGAGPRIGSVRLWLAVAVIAVGVVVVGLNRGGDSGRHGYTLAQVQAAALASVDVSKNANSAYPAVKYPHVSGVDTLPNGNTRVELSIWIHALSGQQGADHDVTVEVSPRMQIIDEHEVARQGGDDSFSAGTNSPTQTSAATVKALRAAYNLINHYHKQAAQQHTPHHQAMHHVGQPGPGGGVSAG